MLIENLETACVPWISLFTLLPWTGFWRGTSQNTTQEPRPAQNLRMLREFGNIAKPVIDNEALRLTLIRVVGQKENEKET